jgi:flagellar basal body rod protein FlgG
MFNVYSMVDSFGAVDKWLSALNKQAKGSITTGYKAERLTFTGGATEIRQSSATKLFQQAEGNLMYREYIDFSQGSIAISDKDSHAAIAGSGYFLVTDGKEYFLTRDGEFQRTEGGQFKTLQGLMVVDQGLAVSLPTANFTYTRPAITAAEVDSGDTGWRRAGGAGWLPYVAGTTYEEGGSYQKQTVLSKKSFWLDPNNLTGSITVTTDNAGWVMVNGHVLTAADATAGTPPSDWSSPVTYNLAPYLQVGSNTISIIATENGGGESISVTGTIGGVAVPAANTWGTKIVPGAGYDATLNTPVPASGKLALADASLDDVVLVQGPIDTKELEISQYGSTVFRWRKMPTNLTILDPGSAGVGNIVHNALENANVTMQQLAPEIAMAQQMYSNLRTILQLKKSNFDLMMAAVK